MKILVVDADDEFLGLISFVLRQAHYLVIEATNGMSALAICTREMPTLIILDVNLPDMSGFELCRTLRGIRAHASTPIMLLTACETDSDQATGLDAGADEYLTKPFSPRIFLAHVRALLRRVAIDRPAPPAYGQLMLDVACQNVSIAGQPPIHLTPLEGRLLHYLLINAEQVVPFERLMTHIWGYRQWHDRQMLKQLVHRLRRKIESEPAQPPYIRSVAGVGYVLQADQGVLPLEDMTDRHSRAKR